VGVHSRHIKNWGPSLVLQYEILSLFQITIFSLYQPFVFPHVLRVFGLTFCSCLSQVPIFMISGATEKIIAFTNAVPEWLCKPRQEKVTLLTMLILTYEFSMVLLERCLLCSCSLGRHYLAMWSFWRKANYLCSLICTRRACCKKFIKKKMLAITTCTKYTW
jgi:hypothetical protein